MVSMHVPARFTQISRSFAKTDGTAWIVALAGIGTAALICAAFFQG
jgi:hypothetical protein